MKTGFPRPRSFVFETTSNPYQPRKGQREGSYGKKWEHREYPHPYTAEEYNLARINRTRLFETIDNKLCGTCGLPVEEDLVGLILYNPHTRNHKISENRKIWFHGESGPYHLKCLSLNFTMCPMLSQTKLYIPAVALWDDVKNIIAAVASNSF